MLLHLRQPLHNEPTNSLKRLSFQEQSWREPEHSSVKSQPKSRAFSEMGTSPTRTNSDWLIKPSSIDWPASTPHNLTPQARWNNLTLTKADWVAHGESNEEEVTKGFKFRGFDCSWAPERFRIHHCRESYNKRNSREDFDQPYQFVHVISANILCDTNVGAKLFVNILP